MPESYWSDGERTIIHGDCLAVLPTLPDASVDFVFADPPYPEISRPYGRMTEADWRAMMDRVVNECRRLLTPTGSAMFVLQPNSEKVGRMRSWLWEFMAYWSREWNQVQDLWWWNHAALPKPAAHLGLFRASLKAIVWLGGPACYRDQGQALWTVSLSSVAEAAGGRAFPALSPNGSTVNRAMACRTAIARGGATPYNVWPIANANSASSSGVEGHGAGTPLPLVRKMVSYACPPGGLVCDPFFGVGTTGVACKETGRRCIAIEKERDYCEASVKRIEASKAPEPTLFAEVAGA